VIAHYLVIEDLLLLKLLENLFDLLSDLNVTNALLLLVVRSIVSQLQENVLIVDSLLLNLSMQRVNLLTHLRRLVIRKIDCTEDVRSLHIVID
jgi:hypothetical protein